MGINKAILVGTVGNDPEVKYIKEDLPVAKFSLATNETYRDKSGEKVTTTEWHNIVVWRGLAKVVEQYVKKGSQLYIEGKITHRTYEKDGQTKYFTEILVNTLQLLGKPNSSGTNQQGGTSSKPADIENTSVENEATVPFDNNIEIPVPEESDDLPF